MEELIKAMSNEDLATLGAKYKDNPSVTSLIDGILVARKREEAEAKAKARFTLDISKLFAKLPHPEDVHNVYAAWREVEMPIEGSKPERLADEVCIANKLELGTMRQPTTKQMCWVVETNKGFQAGKASGSTTQGKVTNTLAILVSKRSVGDSSQLVLAGKFPNASRACEYLKLPIGGDSANRVLARAGFFVEAYNGTDYTS